MTIRNLQLGDAINPDHRPPRATTPPFRHGRPSEAEPVPDRDGDQGAQSDLFLGDDVSRQIWKLLRCQCYQRRWLTPLLEDALQEVEAILQEWDLGPVRHKFTHRHFGDPDYLVIKDGVFRAIDKILDKFRSRHKIEVKADSVWFDPSKAKPGQRQRRELPRNISLGQDDHCLPDDKDGGVERCDLSLDISSAMEALNPIGREVIFRKAQLGQTWESIAEALEVPVSRAKTLYKESMSLLTERLKDYREPVVPATRDLRDATPTPDPKTIHLDARSGAGY